MLLQEGVDLRWTGQGTQFGVSSMASLNVVPQAMLHRLPGGRALSFLGPSLPSHLGGHVNSKQPEGCRPFAPPRGKKREEDNPAWADG